MLHVTVELSCKSPRRNLNYICIPGIKFKPKQKPAHSSETPPSTQARTSPHATETHWW